MSFRPILTPSNKVKPVAHVATFSLATFAEQSVKLPTSCTGKEVGEIRGEVLKI